MNGNKFETFVTDSNFDGERARERQGDKFLTWPHGKIRKRTKT